MKDELKHEGGYLDDVDAIMIPEPTKRDGENQGIFASKGSIMYAVHAAGKAAHSSMPELGINAIIALADFIQKVQAVSMPSQQTPPCKIKTWAPPSTSAP